MDTIDWPVKNHPGGEAYVGESSPFSNSASNPVAWRCWAGIVLGCYAGASGGPCLKVDSRTEPWPELAEWCRAHPNEPPPYAVTGHNNAYEWGCNGSTPRITRTIIPGESIDGLDYAIGPWFEIKR